MSLSSDLRKFIDPSYEDFTAFPSTPAQVAEKWGEAFKAAWIEAVTPSSPAGLVAVGAADTIVSELQNSIAGEDAENPQLPSELDAALAAAADAAVRDSGPAQAVAPSESFNSESEVFKGLELEEQEGSSIGKQIADLAQERFSAWIVTGEFTAFASSPSPIPEIPWGAAPVQSEEEEAEEEPEED